MQALLALLKIERVERIRTWKQATLTIMVTWALVVSVVALEQQSILMRALFPRAAVTTAPRVA
jgi:hypothetical protein